MALKRWIVTESHCKRNLASRQSPCSNSRYFTDEVETCHAHGVKVPRPRPIFIITIIAIVYALGTLIPEGYFENTK